MGKFGSLEGFKKIDSTSWALMGIAALGAAVSGFAVFDHSDYGLHGLSGELENIHSGFLARLGGLYGIGMFGCLLANNRNGVRAFGLLAAGSGFLYFGDELINTLGHSNETNILQWGGLTTTALASTVRRTRDLYKNLKS